MDRLWPFPDHGITIKLRELSFSDAGFGYKTWGCSLLLSKYLIHISNFVDCYSCIIGLF